MRSYGRLTKRRFLLLLSSCALIGPTQYEPTLADYIRESERIEAPAHNGQELANSITESVRRLRREHARESVLIDTTNPPWLTGVVRAAGFSGRAARGSVAPRKMACHPAARAGSYRWSKAIDSRSKGQP
jgi:hypothetical protein